MKRSVPPVEDLEVVSEKLLDLIEQGDPTVILSPEYTFSLNELFKHELIIIHKENLVLTEKGRKAKELGMRSFLDQKNILEKPEFSIGKNKNENKFAADQPFFIILLFVLIGLLSILIWTGGIRY